ncbi:MAG: hypothetical protein WCH39_15600 [Schlesneria sp.]
MSRSSSIEVRNATRYSRTWRLFMSADARGMWLLNESGEIKLQAGIVNPKNEETAGGLWREDSNSMEMIFLIGSLKVAVRQIAAQFDVSE